MSGLFGGGGGAQQVAAAPTPTPAPPVTSSQAEVIQAEHDVAQQNLMKKSIKNTVYAGDTGGFKGPGAVAPQNAAVAPTASFKSKLG